MSDGRDEALLTNGRYRGALLAILIPPYADRRRSFERDVGSGDRCRKASTSSLKAEKNVGDWGSKDGIPAMGASIRPALEQADHSSGTG